MRDRREQILRLSCLVLGALLAFQLVRFIISGDPAKALVIPALPSLPPELEAQAGKGTNAAGLKGAAEKSTNGPGLQVSGKTGTNGQKSEITPQKADGRSNSLVASEGKIGVESATSGKSISTNAGSAPGKSTMESNIVAIATTKDNLVKSSTTNAPGGTNQTNLVLASATSGTNAAAGLKVGTNVAALKASARTNGPPSGRMGMPGKPPELPADIKERVDRITQGEILGQVMRPMPMALLGIAGQNAFLRSPDGQTGMIKEGDQLGPLKLLRIGINRVLIEQEGEKKELSIFDGFGSETMMPKEVPAKEKKTNEPPTKSP